MKQLASATALLLGFATVAMDRGYRLDEVSAAVAGEHDYFDTLSRRSDVWKSYSLRSSNQIRAQKEGGYVEGGGSAIVQWASYDPENDTDRNRQDGAKVVIPAFMETTTTLTEAYRPLYPVGRVIKVDREVMTVTSWLTDTTISVVRGAYASASAAHSAGAVLMHSTNSLRNQIRLPLGTEDGHSYFFTWDTYWTDS